MQVVDFFKVEDQVLGLGGLYFLWTCLFVSNFVCLLVDDSSGVERDFNVITNVLSVIYGGIASANNIYGNKLNLDSTCCLFKSYVFPCSARASPL